MAAHNSEHLKHLLKAIKAADDDDDIIQLCHEITKITQKEVCLYTVSEIYDCTCMYLLV